MMGDHPVVTIGMPTYNGARFIREALDSLLAQDFSDFELIVSDNASTDRTEAICREYAARDSRVRYYRVERNEGAVWNFNRVFELARGKYFMWAADDDIRAPEYLAECLRVISEDEGVAIVHTFVETIDEDGSFIRVEDSDLAADSPSPRERSRKLLEHRFWTYAFYGLIRAETLRASGPLGTYVWFDYGMVYKLSLYGKIVQVRAPLFRYRLRWLDLSVVDYIRKIYESLSPSHRHRRLTSYRLIQGLNHARDVWRAPLPALTKLAVMKDLACYYTWHPASLDDLRRIVAEALGPRRVEDVRRLVRALRR
jgi:glycosyltransferase involved in cell wall biosynthesis